MDIYLYRSGLCSWLQILFFNFWQCLFIEIWTLANEIFLNVPSLWHLTIFGVAYVTFFFKALAVIWKRFNLSKTDYSV